MLARRTDVDFGVPPSASASAPSSTGSPSAPSGVDPTELVAALAGREPRAYQFLLDLGAPRDGGGEGAQSFLPAFVCSSPEQLFARSGRAVASEAVAGTRARGPPGADAEADFWLSLDLLSHPKDHAEFVIVRDWVAGALERVCGEEEEEARDGGGGGGGGGVRGGGGGGSAGAGDEQSPPSSSPSSSPSSRSSPRRPPFPSSSSFVRIDRPKGILKQGGVQHLHARLSGTLRASATDADVLAALHPTPAVCGRPRALAKRVLREREGFDRGLYAGPVGWVSGSGAEFAVAIRSARLDRDPLPLLSPPRLQQRQQQQQQQQQQRQQHPASRLSAFAGVGVVSGSRPRGEWAELELKAEQLLAPLAPAADPRSEPNAAAAAAALAVEELCRLGCPAFCVAPGARSSPLALAVARHPVAAARLHRGLDERSLAFFALGVGRATGRAAVVITTSGTAVANLLPAAVEASMAGAPLLLLTADRPSELRGTGANQTIDQVGIFGGYVRHFADVAPPCSAEGAAAAAGGRGGGARVLCEVGRAFDAACRGVPSSSRPPGAPPRVLPGPAHLNLQLSEPLGRSPGEFPRGFWSGTEGWLRGKARFQEEEVGVGVGLGGAQASSSPAIPASLLELIASARRPLLVLGEARTAADAAAAARIAAALNGRGGGRGVTAGGRCRWPVAADALSGVRVGRSDSPSSPPWLLSSPDAALASGGPGEDGGGEGAWGPLRPDLVLQVGGRLTSKRLAAFLGWAASAGPPLPSDGGAAKEEPTFSWVLVDEACDWFDPAGPGAPPTARVSAPAAALAAALEEAGRTEDELAPPSPSSSSASASSSAFASLWRLVDAAAASAAAALLDADTAVAAAVSSSSSSSAGGGSRRSLGGGGRSTGLLSEPAAVALVARRLPRGASLFVGNSMPIRDVEAYGSLPSLPSSTSSSSSPPPPSLGDAPALPGAPSAPRIAASRGASGIDGVLSTAAGFAAGTGRPATLVVGDLSFLHDTNGLALLRDGEGRPPLTVVVLNNDGGGIFHLVKDIADGTRESPPASRSPSPGPSPTSLGLGELDAVWATPQGADLGALCRAHGVPHQRVFSGSGSGSSPSSLPAAAAAKGSGSDGDAVAALSSALDAAAALGSSSVVEVICPRRERNAELHRRLSGAAGAAGSAAARLWARAGGGVSVVAASVRPLRIPLARPLTTKEEAPSPSSRAPSPPPPLSYRQCFLLRLDCETGDGRRVSGEGEISPLPGLSSESAAAAAAQAASLCSILNGNGGSNGSGGGGGGGGAAAAGAAMKTPLPLDAPALAGGMTRWLSVVAGEGCSNGSSGKGKDKGKGKGRLAPSVRFGVEAAVLGALAEAAGCDVPSLLAGFRSGEGDFSSSSSSSSSSSVPVAGLISTGSATEAAALAAAFAASGHRAVKVKVARRGSSPLRDAEIVRAVAEAVSAFDPGRCERKILVRADANRGWTLEEASEFAAALEGGGASGDARRPRVLLDFLEEPLADPGLDLESFAAAFPLLPLALDETVDEALVGGVGSGGGGLSALLLSSSSSASATPAALVLKPSVLGGFDAVAAAARAAALAASSGKMIIRCVVSSAFEGDAGLRAAAALALAVSPPRRGKGGETEGGEEREEEEVHGLGTASWFSGAAVERGGSSISAERAGKVARGGAAAAVAAPRPRWEEGRVAAPECGVVFRTRTLSSSSAAAAAAAAATEPVSRRGGEEQRRQPPPPPTVVLLLHGFMGTAEDWEGIGEGLLFSAAAESGSGRGVVIVAADLPLHGQTTTVSSSPPDSDSDPDDSASWPAAVAAVRELCSVLSEKHAGGRPIAVAGYSLGARLAAAAAAAAPKEQRGGAVGRLALVAGGAPQLSLAASHSLSAARAARDDELARALLRSAGEASEGAAAARASAFARSWYASSPLWAPLAASRRRVFSSSSSSSSSSSLLDAVVASRAAAIEERGSDLAAALSGFSPGRTAAAAAEPRGALPPSPTPPTIFVAGGEDPRCASEAAAAAKSAGEEGSVAELVILEGVGHAVPSEAPVVLAGVLADWLFL